MIKVGGQFSGVGAFDQALKRLGIESDNIYQAEWDKYARQTYLLNFEKPKYYVNDVYDTPIEEITDKHGSLDIAMFSPPCQSFSIAGKREGENSDKGVLFYNSLEFITKNKPRTFIFENVQGLLSSKSCITYRNSLYLLLYNFKQINEWQTLQYQKNNLNLLSQSITNYLCLNYAKKLGLKKSMSGTSYIINSELGYEKLEKKVKSGLKRRLIFLEKRICQITKRYDCCQTGRIHRLEDLEKDLVLNQDQSHLIKNLSMQVISLLEKTVGISPNTSLFANNILEDNSKKGKLYTTLTELNLIMTNETFLYVLEKNIIRLIILALDLSSNLWKEIWHILTGKKEFIGLKTFDVWLFSLDQLNYHIYWQVLNAKDYNIPQNRERVFIVGIRDDSDNRYQFPKKERLTRKLKDILEENVDEKYYLSEKTISYVLKRENVYTDFNPEISRTVCSQYAKSSNGSFIKLECKFGFDTCCNLGLMCSDCEEGCNYEMLETEPNILEVGTWRTHKDDYGFRKTKDNNCSTILARAREDGSSQVVLKTNHKIRRLTPLECFRAMDFNEDFKWNVSPSQAYKQAGNSICVGV